MTDTHSHILFGIDDGSINPEESLRLLKRMAEIGFTDIILTPHYIESTEYSANNEEKTKRFLYLKEAVKQNNINISLHLGNEIFIHNDILSSINNGLIFGLNQSNYLLIELPFHNQIINLEDMIYELQIQGYIPVIAHPERYTYFQENPKLIEPLKEMGVLFQCNYSSILGYYHKEAEKLMKYLLKKEYVDFLGTDIHHINKTYVIDNYPKIKKSIIKITGPKYYDQIMSNCNNLIK